MLATRYKKKQFWNKSKLAIFLKKSGCEKQSIILYRNTKGLPLVYNAYIAEEYRNKKIIFMHDDVMIRDLFWEEKLNDAFLKYDLFGVIGTKSCNMKLNV